MAIIAGMRSFRSNRLRWLGVDLGESGVATLFEHA